MAHLPAPSNKNIVESTHAEAREVRSNSLSGASAAYVHGYRGLVRELVMELKRELKARRLPVVATGGYGDLIASRLPEITAVDPLLTLEGLRLVWLAQRR